MVVRTVEFLALLLMAVALVPGGAHVLELPAKIGMDCDTYFAVQQIYAGWSLAGIALVAALVMNIALAVALYADRQAFTFALLAAMSVVVSLAIFFGWTYPANEATANWTRPTEDWEVLRRNWEYSHAVNALVLLLGFCSATFAVLSTKH